MDRVQVGEELQIARVSIPKTNASTNSRTQKQTHRSCSYHGKDLSKRNKKLHACTQHLADSQNLRIHHVPETHPINTATARAIPAPQTSHLCRRRPARSASSISNMSRQTNTLEPRQSMVLSKLIPHYSSSRYETIEARRRLYPHERYKK